MINILDVDTIKESNKRRVIDLESKITWLIESFEIEKRKMRVEQMDEMNFNISVFDEATNFNKSCFDGATNCNTRGLMKRQIAS